MSAPAYIYFGVILAITAIGMIYNAVSAAMEKRRAGRG
jgi:hypothetical protein